VPKKWAAAAKLLPLGGKVYLTCPSCGTDNKFAVFHDKDAYRGWCFKCHYGDTEHRQPLTFAERQAIRKANLDFETGAVQLPDLADDIPAHGLLWFLKAGISTHTAKVYGIGYSEKMDRVVVPVYTDGELLAVQARALNKGQVPKYLNSKSPAGDALFQSRSSQRLPDLSQYTDVLVLTEDALSAIRVGRVIDAWALLGTSISTGQVARIIRHGYNTVVVWLDNDAAGRSGRIKVVSKLMAAGLNVRWISAEHDPKEYTNKEIKEYVEQCLI